MDNKIIFEEETMVFSEKTQPASIEYDPTKYIWTEEGSKSNIEINNSFPLAARDKFGLVKPGDGLDIIKDGILILNLGYGFVIDPITKKLVLSVEVIPHAGNNISIVQGVEGEYTVSVIGENVLEPNSDLVPTSKATADYITSKTGNLSSINSDIQGATNDIVSALNKLKEQSFYHHTQITPSDTWIINHPLKKRPSITIMTEDNKVVIGDIEYPSADQVILRFSSGFSGSAVLN